jgi:hypothetical protein
MNQLNINQAAGVELVRAADRQGLPVMGLDMEKLPIRGRFQVEHIRGGKVIGNYDFPNGITNEGKNHLLDVHFHGTTAIATWYLGLIDNAGYTALAAADIYDNINQAGNGWDEFANYTDDANADSTTTRPAWVEGAASGQSITNASPIIFDITGTGTVKGVFLAGGTNAQTKSDHTSGSANKLWATALFTGGDVAVLNGDQLKVTYTVSA